MSWYNKVIWSEGMFLRPQHFQQQDRYFHNQLRRAQHAADPWGWGLSRLEIDRDALTLGKFSLLACEGIMPDGTAFRAPEETDPPPPREIAAGTANQILYLGLPIERIGSAATDVSNEVNGLARFSSFEIDVYDTAAGTLESLAGLTVGGLRLRLLLENDEKSGYHLIPLARLVEVSPDNKLILDEAFIPTVVAFATAPPLAAFMRETEALLHERGEALAGRMVDSSRGGVAELAEFLLLQLVNRVEPLAAHLNTSAALHPERLYGLLIQLAGELATFTRADKRPEAFPAYRHQNLTETFFPVMTAIRQALSAVQDPNAVQIPLEERKYGIRVAIVHDRSLISDAAFILAVMADMPAEDLGRILPPQIKIGPVERIRELVNLAIPGVGVRQLPVAPRQIPYHAGAMYFELDTTNELWKTLDRSAGLAFHIAGAFPNLRLALWAVRR